MKKELIIILSGAEDSHADWVEDMLRQRQVEFLRFTPAKFPQKASISLSYLPSGQTEYCLKVGENIIDLQKVKAIWNRRPEAPTPHPEFTDKPTRQFLSDECGGFIQDAFAALKCLWFPAPPNILHRANLKGLQLKLAGEIGFDIPPTLITNSTEDFIEFYNQNKGQIISKVAGPKQLRHLSDDFGRFTELVSFQDLAHAHALQYCPIIFQAYVPKLVELRITVVGKTVLAAEIHSQKSNHARHDWRRHDFSSTQYWPHELPQEIAEKCVSLTEKLGLNYGAIDMILTPEKKYIFVEINPNGQYLWIEKMTGLPISDAICDFLIAGNLEKQLATAS